MTEIDPNEANFMVSEVRIIKYVDPSGELHTVDMSRGAGGSELDEAEYLSLLEWGRAWVLAARVMSIIAAETEDIEDEDGYAGA
ncbi:hypothetical protein [Mycobacteroides abscessus]|uniref:hypothetical protein n=1 Tax=Mycobacteroides abscessus TaxID=36809 RepID=UPI00189684B6|nr:hypothetical protein [Mycobacteroides abscessus]